MGRIVAILCLALCICVGTTFAQDGQKKKGAQITPRRSVEDVFKARDKDRDGKLSKAEFIGKAKKDPEHIKVLEKRFNAIDTNGDGEITIDELKAFWAKQVQEAEKRNVKRLPQKEKGRSYAVALTSAIDRR